MDWRRNVLLPTVAEDIIIGGTNAVALAWTLREFTAPVVVVLLLGELFVAWVLHRAFQSRKRAFERRKLSFEIDSDRLRVIDESGHVTCELVRRDILSSQASRAFEGTKGDDPQPESGRSSTKKAVLSSTRGSHMPVSSRPF